MSSTCFETLYVPCGCKAFLNPKDPRAEIWMAVFGKLEFPLKHPIPHKGVAVGEHSASFLQGDWDALSLDQRSLIRSEMKKRFGISDHIFDHLLNTFGYIPIKDENITIQVCLTHSRMMMSP